jgi:hypothetical protein
MPFVKNGFKNLQGVCFTLWDAPNPFPINNDNFRCEGVREIVFGYGDEHYFNKLGH